MNELPPIAVTMGDPAGIGGEITLKAWLQRKSGTQPYFIIDDPGRLQGLAKRLQLPVPIEIIQTPGAAKQWFAKALPVLAQRLEKPVTPGQPDPANAPAVQQAIETAVKLTVAGEASAVVTNPIQKECLYDAGFKFPGHTEFLAELAGITTPPVMMLACSALRVIPVTVHQSLQAAITGLNQECIIEKALIAAGALQRDFAVTAPRLAIAGLNPHAGEGGAMGDEENTLIMPAVTALRDRGVDVTGPLPADTMFSAAMRQTYDAAICMYHDQALIPIKTLDFEHAVNITLGLPFIRTSPDHGTALDIAGQGIARETSLLAALSMATEMAKHRRTASLKQKSRAEKPGLISA